MGEKSAKQQSMTAATNDELKTNLKITNRQRKRKQTCCSAVVCQSGFCSGVLYVWTLYPHNISAPSRSPLHTLDVADAFILCVMWSLFNQRNQEDKWQKHEQEWKLKENLIYM